jgi:uncharacterized integral membrane protein
VRLLRRRDRTDHEGSQARLYARLIVLALLVAYAIAFVLENGKHVSVHFVFTTTQVSLVWLILLCFAIGLLVGVLAVQLDRRRRRRRRDEQAGEPSDAVADLGR